MVYRPFWKIPKSHKILTQIIKYKSIPRFYLLCTFEFGSEYLQRAKPNISLLSPIKTFAWQCETRIPICHTIKLKTWSQLKIIRAICVDPSKCRGEVRMIADKSHSGDGALWRLQRVRRFGWFGSQQCVGSAEQFVSFDNAARHIDHYLWSDVKRRFYCGNRWTPCITCDDVARRVARWLTADCPIHNLSPNLTLLWDDSHRGQFICIMISKTLSSFQIIFVTLQTNKIVGINFCTVITLFDESSRVLSDCFSRYMKEVFLSTRYINRYLSVLTAN